MIKFKVVTKETQEADIVKCDLCGTDYPASDLEVQEFQHIRFCGGYGSVFSDGTEVECDICQHCLQKLIGNFCRQKPAT